jgi:hypothetical protein
MLSNHMGGGTNWLWGIFHKEMSRPMLQMGGRC